MEALSLNKQAIREDFSACVTLENLISTVENRLSQTDKVVCKIVVNGLLLSEEDEARLAPTRLTEIDFIEIEFRSKKQLVEDSARELKAWIDQFKTVILGQADKIRTQGQLTNFDFTQTVKNMFWLIGAIKAVKAHRAEQYNWENVEHHMTAAIREVETAYTAQDHILLADVLEYEVSSGLDQWRVLLDSIESSGTK
ncbi:MAG: hypothetical protein AABZ31_15405 [Bdellovibrionota bacterium]